LQQNELENLWLGVRDGIRNWLLTAAWAGRDGRQWAALLRVPELRCQENRGTLSSWRSQHQRWPARPFL